MLRSRRHRNSSLFRWWRTVPFPVAASHHAVVPTAASADQLVPRAAPAWSLGAYLLLGLLLRLPAVCWAEGFEFVDQQYQYVDPAWHYATGGAWHRTWEWFDGVRSHVYPLALAVLFRGLLALGFEDPLLLAAAVRLVGAGISLLPLAAFWWLLVRWRPVPRPQVPLLLFACSGLLVSGVQPSGPALASTLAVTAGILLAGPTARHAALAGLCLGFAFCGRFQDAMFGPAFLGVLWWQRRWSAAACFVGGCLPGIALQGLVDLWTEGGFLVVPWRYLHTNIGLRAAEKWRTQPWWFYALAGVVPTTMLVPGLLRVAWARLLAGGALLPAAFAGAVLHLVLHSFVARKALRFEYPALALLLAVVAAGLPARVGRAARSHTVLLFVLHLGLWCWASLLFGNAGAVRTALWLHQQPGFRGAVLVVDGDPTSLGGYFHLRPPTDRAVGVRREELTAVWSRRAVEFDHVVVVRAPLAEQQAGELDPPLELVASFRGAFDLRTGDRRYVYRPRPRAR
jgi:Alg9-like mannosyltransferase family